MDNRIVAGLIESLAATEMCKNSARCPRGLAVGVSKAYCVAGLVLTGGLRPHQTIMRLIRRTTIPVIAV